MANLESLQEDIFTRYQHYFKKLGIDNNSGIWENQDTKLRFATMPHIGNEYHNATTKILFVGMDIGKDESNQENKIQSFEERHDSLCARPRNPHMFGTYMEALYFLRPQIWDAVFERYKNRTNQRALESILKEYPEVSELGRYFSLTNFHKFVTLGRITRSGDENRQNYNIADLTYKIFCDEVEILKPNIIWFQGHKLSCEKYQELANNGYDVYVAYHPAVRGRCIFGRRPAYIKSVIEDSTDPIRRKYTSQK